ncbi:hypothetical protein AUP42_10155 [Thalassospira lucentensis]|uniref:Uncharacterized protein n=1 Tax=Thalassospira lucentensis TaxID=168935 RepID=A0A154LB18_9PROT|nr:hypothetical protein AUP42_10155 [Thalassospira lucentensis]RCK35888.1 hypothetical protein TH9_04285 [Thalassospira xiamenensis]
MPDPGTAARSLFAPIWRHNPLPFEISAFTIIATNTCIHIHLCMVSVIARPVLAGYVTKTFE